MVGASDYKARNGDDLYTNVVNLVALGMDVNTSPVPVFVLQRCKARRGTDLRFTATPLRRDYRVVVVGM